MTDYRTPLFDPARIPQVALASMNHTHAEEVELINRLGTLLAEGSQGRVYEAAITSTIEEWFNHTLMHFQRENELMESHGFPAYPVHRGEHERVLSLIDGLRQQWLKAQEIEPLATFLFEQWPEWFDSHVNSMDRVTAQFIARCT